MISLFHWIPAQWPRTRMYTAFLGYPATLKGPLWLPPLSHLLEMSSLGHWGKREKNQGEMPSYVQGWGLHLVQLSVKPKVLVCELGAEWPAALPSLLLWPQGWSRVFVSGLLNQEWTDACVSQVPNTYLRQWQQHESTDLVPVFWWHPACCPWGTQPQVRASR